MIYKYTSPSDENLNKRLQIMGVFRRCEELSADMEQSERNLLLHVATWRDFVYFILGD